MNINGVNRATSPYIYTSKTNSVDMTFAETLGARKKSRDSLMLSSDGKSPSSDMTAEEYRIYICGKVSAMRKAPSENNYTVAYISDEGYEAMRNDPEYERWVLDRLSSAFSYSSHGCLGKKETVNTAVIIGASEEECRFESWSSSDFKGPTDKEIRETRLERRLKSEKLKKYRKALQENSIKRAENELDHIRGIYRDQIHEKKDICAQLNVNKLFFKQT